MNEAERIELASRTVKSPIRLRAGESIEERVAAGIRSLEYCLHTVGMMKSEIDLCHTEEDEGSKRLKTGVATGPAGEEQGLGGVARAELRTGEGERSEEGVGARGMTAKKRTRQDIRARERPLGETRTECGVVPRGLHPLRGTLGTVPAPTADEGEGEKESDKKTSSMTAPPADEALDLFLVELVVEMFAHSVAPGATGRGL